MRSIWWGPTPAENHNDALHELLSEFLTKLERQIPAMLDKVQKARVESSAVSATSVGPAKTFSLDGKVAVLPLAAGADVKAESVKSIDDLVVSELTARLTDGVIGMSDIQAMIGFEKVQDLAGCATNSCMAEIGGALGVDYLVTGKLGAVGSYLILSMSVIDTRNARAVSRVTRKVSRDDMARVVDALPGAIQALLEGR